MKFTGFKISLKGCGPLQTEAVTDRGEAVIDRGGGNNRQVENTDKSLWINFKPKHRFVQWAELSFNPVVTITSLTAVIAFVAWSIANEEIAMVEFGSWKAWMGKTLNWFYIGTKDVWLLFVIYLYFSKYSSVKLGKDDSVPEYDDGTWFSMLFACGVGTGLFFFGVGEPLLHYTGKNRYSSNPFLQDNTLAQEAINITLYHWGVHAWTVYCIVGMLSALMAYREDLPLTIKSCLHPLIGDKIFGWPGDLVDILSVISTLFGVCTSLGLGTIQLNGGLNTLNPDIPVSIQTQVLIIWIITGVATFSVMTGLQYGVRRLSEICFCSGVLLMLATLLLDNTLFILNLFVQSLGFYMQWLLQLGFHSDAFEQLGPSHGSGSRGRFVPENTGSSDGPEQWMDSWTIFYWGWWVAWSPFVGMFIAKISQGRTVKEFICGTMAAPVLYTFMWLVIFGGAGLRMEREAAEAQICCHNINTTHIIEMAIEHPIDTLEDRFVDSFCLEDSCSPCSLHLLEGLSSRSLEQVREEMEQVQVENWGLTTPNRNLTRLSCRDIPNMWFDLMISYGDIGKFLSGFSLLSLVLYFVTSSDSGSLVIDCLASNGNPEPPTLQRVAWAVIEGLTATTLLVAGGTQALSALQAVSLTTGGVYTVLLCLMCSSLLKVLQKAVGETTENENKFSIHILDPFLSDPLKDLLSSSYWEVTQYKLSLVPCLLFNLLATPYSVAKVSRVVSGTFYVPLISTSILLFLFILLHCIEPVVGGAWSIAWVMYTGFVFLVASIRKETRTHYNIPGSFLSDLLVCLFLYPAAALQMVITVNTNQHKQSTNDNLPPRSSNREVDEKKTEEDFQLNINII